MKLLIMQSSPASRHLLHVRFKYPPHLLIAPNLIAIDRAFSEMKHEDGNTFLLRFSLIPFLQGIHSIGAETEWNARTLGRPLTQVETKKETMEWSSAHHKSHKALRNSIQLLHHTGARDHPIQPVSTW
jgi:hypothetical protein